MKTTLGSSGVANFHASDARLQFKYGRGPWAVLTDGREMADFVLGFGPVVLGHADQVFVSKVTKLLAQGLHLPGFSELHHDFAKAFFAGSGPWEQAGIGIFKQSSDAISAAIRMCSFVTGRKGIIRCGFTGWHDVQLASSPRWHEQLDSPIRTQRRFTEHMRGVSSDETVFDWIDLQSESLRSEIESRPSHYACIIIDAYQLSYASPSAFCHVLERCREAGILIVFDETKTAGRTSRLGAMGRLEIRPDMIVLGKAIANGAPLSLLVTRVEFVDLFREARVGGTHSKELFGLYAAIATMELMDERDGYQLQEEITDSIVRVVNEAARHVGIAGWIHAEKVFERGMFDIRFSPEIVGLTEARARLPEIFADNGILMLQGHPSFVCLAHGSLPQGWLDERLVRSLTAWKSAVERTKSK